MNDVTCKICGRSFSNFKSLSIHISRGHNLNIIKYYKIYIGGRDFCVSCGDKTTFKSIEHGFREYCSSKCANNDLKIKEKIEKTNIEKYGVKHFNNQEKIQKTNLKKYGVKVCFENEKVKEKIRSTNLEKYGFCSPLKNDNIKLKLINTNLERYSGVTFTSTEEGKNMIINTCLKKYNVKNVFQNEIIKEKIKISNLKKYGVNYPIQSEEIMNKRKISCLKKYGTEHILDLEKYRDKNSFHFIRKYQLSDGRIIFYQSTPELKYIKYCEDNNIYIENGDIIEYEFENRKHKYFIDFKIKEMNKFRLVEIKGNHNWFYRDLKSGKLESKFKSAQTYSIQNEYLDYIFILNGKEYLSYDNLKKDNSK